MTASNDHAETDIAIVGMAGRFPGADDVDALWRRVAAGDDCLTDLTIDQARAAGAAEHDLADPNYVRRSGVLSDVAGFDHEFFGIGSRDADVFDPQHRHFLECAWAALEMSTHLPETFDGAIGVFGGCGMNTYLINNLLTAPGVLERMGWFLLRHTGNDKDFLVNNVAYRLDLHGPAVNVQTACSTSLVAIHLAAQSLLAFECDLALAGGATIEAPHGVGYVHREGEILSADGHCRAFDENSGGTVLTSGVGTLALRRLHDALDDGDPILAVIKGTAINNDGARKVSFLAPSVDGHADVVREALAVAGLTADDLQLIEAHGTGTALGDSIEIAALTEAFRSSTAETGFCRIGSTKPNIGHLDTAAGVASMIKVIQSLRHATLPPMANHTTPSELVDWQKSPFVLSGTAADWPSDRVRRAGVSSLGVGGTNAHVLVEEAPLLAPMPASTPEQMISLSAMSPGSVEGAAQQLADHLERNPDLELADVAHTLITGRRAMPHRRVVTARTSQDAIALLRAPDRHRSFGAEAAANDTRLGFMFPGGGSQYVGMGATLDNRFATFHDLRRQGATIVADLGGPDLLPGFGLDGDAEQLRRPSISLPSVFVTSVALARQWMAFGAEPDVLLGHSLGEYVAAHLAGVLSLEDALSLVVTRSKLMEQVGGPDTAMLVVPLDEDQLVATLPDNLSLAAVNAADECVVAGQASDVVAFAAELEALDVSAIQIPLAAAAHSYMLDPVLEEFRTAVNQVTLSAPQIRYPSNLTGTWITEAQTTDPDYWVRHLRGTVRFLDGVRTVCSEGPTILSELGPGHSLSSAARRTTGGPIGVAPALRHPNHEIEDTGFSLQAYARQWALGADLDRLPLVDPDRRRVVLPTYAFDHVHHWIEPGERAPASAAADIAPDHPDSPTIERLTDLDDFTTLIEWAEVEAALEAGTFENFVIHGDEADVLADDVVAALSSRGLAANRMVFDAALETVDASTCLITIAPPATSHRRTATEWFNEVANCARVLGGEPVATRIVAVTRQAFATDGPATNADDALISGVVRVAGREYDMLDGRVIDIGVDAAAALNQLVDEIVGEGPEIVALRNDVRLEQVERSAALAVDGHSSSALEDGATYLITGAFGGVGFALAEHLARDRGANLALLSRAPIPTGTERTRWLLTHGRDDATSRRLRRLAQLEAHGTKIEVIVGDTADALSVKAAVDQARDRLGELHGAIHAAGLMHDQLLALAGDDDFARVIQPKLVGASTLVEDLKRVGASLLVLVGSTSAIVAPAGQSAYVGANAVLDQLAGQHGDLRVVTIDFGLWSVEGMATNAAHADHLGTTNSAPFEHPILDTIGEGRNGSTVLSGRLDPQHHWVLDEHRTGDNTPVLPGTGHIELMCTAAIAAGIESPSLRDVTLLEPVVVPDQTSTVVRVTVTAGDDPQVTVESDDGDSWRLCSQATIEQVQPHGDRPSAVMSIDVADPLAVQRDRLLLGSHWDGVTGARRGEDAAEVVIDLDDTAADASAWTLHPAITDLATSAAVVLASDRSDDALWVPIRYEQVTLVSPIPSTVTATAFRRPAQHEHVVADIDIHDTDGHLVAQVGGIELRAIEGESFRAPSVTDSAEVAGGGSLAALALVHGLTAAEGVALFERVVSSSYDRVLASSLHLDDLRRLTSDAIGDNEPAPQTADGELASGATLDSAVTQIWRDLLGIEDIAPTDDFFDLGGHSLIAIRLMSRINRDLGVRLELVDLLSASTIATLTARLIEVDPEIETRLFSEGAPPSSSDQRPSRSRALDDASAGPMSTLVTISASGEGRPLYVVHGAGGNVLFLWSLARAMSGSRPIYGFQAKGVNGQHLPDSTVEEMAARYIVELRKHAPGPYLLGGFSGGGLVTLEMAHQLRELGEEVDLAVLFDSAPSGKMSPGLLARLRSLGRHIQTGPLSATVPYIKRGIGRRLRRLVPEEQARLTEIADQERALGYAETESQGYVDLFHYISAAADRYETKSYDVDVLLVKADRVWPGQEPDYHWGPYMNGEFNMISVPGDHHSMFFPENAPGLAAALSPILDQCDQDRSDAS